MPPPASRESSGTRPSSRNGSSSSGRSANVSRDDTHGGAKPRGRSRGINSGSDTDGSTDGGNVTDRTTGRRKMHSNPDSGNPSDRAYSRGPRAPSQASSTRSKRAKSPERIYLFGDDPYSGLAPEGHKVSLYDDDDGYLTDHGQRAQSESRKKTSKRDRSREAPETIRPPLAPLDGEKYLPGQLSNPQAKAKRRTVEHVNVYAKGEVPILETCSDWEEEPKIKRKPIKKREQSQGSISRHAEPELSRHRSGDGKNLKVKSRSEPMRQPPGGEQTRDEDRDGAWHKHGGKVRTRDSGHEAKINGGLANKDDFLGLREDWLRGKTHADSTPNGLVNQPESTPQPVYANNKRDPGPASDQGRKHHKGTEQHIPPHKLFDTIAGRPPQEEEKKRKKSPSRLLQRIFKS
ncbi:hypothetical protein BTUL_0093g00210 [Botrytis tulipae]|uniref:Uncharacterized protein n=1 Tax=Botrytis tulipae TaxID=87230 RepID=A0A4Z1EP53_9HELO|nr:hypothetical protein BTUL_0093g00210 [Botrytis tulipae]